LGRSGWPRCAIIDCATPDLVRRDRITGRSPTSALEHVNTFRCAPASHRRHI